MMSEMKRVMSVGAHSLDAELLGGPLLLRYAKAGAHVSCIHVTQGRLEDPEATEEAKKAYLAELLETNRKAAQDLMRHGLDMFQAICHLRKNLRQGWKRYLQMNMSTL